MTPAAAVFDRYKRRRIALYGADLRGLSAPCDPGLVSIVLPAWNGAATIRESIDSILGQTHQHFELIVVSFRRMTSRSMGDIKAPWPTATRGACAPRAP
jgi:hypothetical protein